MTSRAYNLLHNNFVECMLKSNDKDMGFLVLIYREGGRWLQAS